MERGEGGLGGKRGKVEAAAERMKTRGDYKM